MQAVKKTALKITPRPGPAQAHTRARLKTDNSTRAKTKTGHLSFPKRPAPSVQQYLLLLCFQHFTRLQQIAIGIVQISDVHARWQARRLPGMG